MALRDAVKRGPRRALALIPRLASLWCSCSLVFVFLVFFLASATCEVVGEEAVSFHEIFFVY